MKAMELKCISNEFFVEIPPFFNNGRQGRDLGTGGLCQCFEYLTKDL